MNPFYWALRSESGAGPYGRSYRMRGKLMILAIGLLCATAGRGAGQEKANDHNTSDKSTSSVYQLLGISEHDITAAQPSKKPLTPEEATKEFQHLEGWSQKPNIVRAAQVKSSLQRLKNNPDAATSLFMSAFFDPKRDMNFRINCAGFLREIGKPIPSIYEKKLQAIVENTSENSILRIDAANMLLSEEVAVKPAVRAVISRRMQELYKTGRAGEEKPHIRLHVFPLLKGDAQLEAVLIAELSRTSSEDLGPTLQVLGKMQTRAAIPPIKRLLDENFKSKKFPKTRAYLALGRIGGEQAYNTLVGYLPREKNITQKNMILFGIGLTKSSNAKNFLLNCKERKSSNHDGAVLQAFRFLGDTSVIPALEQERQETSDPGKKSDIQLAIDIIRKGGETPPW